MKKWIITIALWGRKYKGDFIAAEIAFIIPLFITAAIKGFEDIIAITSLVGLTIVSIILIMGSKPVYSFLIKFWMRTRFTAPLKIGVLSGYLEETKKGKLPNQHYTQYTPQEWYDALSSNTDFNVNWTVATDISDNFDVIINPFGDEYPEIDKPNLSTLRSIKKFVKKGGVFVNVSGLAFYYVWDGQKEDLSGPLYETYRIDKLPSYLTRVILLESSPLRDCSLYTFFSIRTTFFDPAILTAEAVSDSFFDKLDNIGGTKKVKEFRSAYRSKSEEFTLIPLLKTAHKIPTRKEFKKKTLDFDCYPIAAVKYGYGYLLLNGFKLEKSRPEDFQKIVESIKCVVKKLSIKGFI